VDPADTAGFLRAAEALRVSPAERQRMGTNARLYAGKTFDLERIADRFENLFESLHSPDVAAEELADEPT
jgi:glycosyltransferase involved in cell wall biosynthesis